jgi:hypothetical protein
MSNQTTRANSKSPLHFSNNEIHLFHQIGGDPLMGWGFETEDPNRRFAVTQLIGPEPNAPEKE